MTDPSRLLVVAGEASADEHAALVLRELEADSGGVAARGMGGVHLADAGMHLDVDLRRVTTMGCTEVTSQLPTIAAAFAHLIGVAAIRRPLAALLVDMPDFNMPLAAALRRLGVPTIGYIAPQIWAWRPGRARVIARRYDHLACIFPFEVTRLRRAGVRTEFVGHPLLDGPRLSREEARRQLEIDPEERCVALLPGSRPGERARLLGRMLDAARIVRRLQAVRFILAIAPSLQVPKLPSWVTPVAMPATTRPGQTTLSAADVAIVASGTATLEAALAGVPQVVVYRLSWPSYLLARSVVRGRFMAMPNILLGTRRVPELLQGAATADAIAHYTLELLRDAHAAREQREAATRVRLRLGLPGASGRVADLLRMYLT